MSYIQKKINSHWHSQENIALGLTPNDQKSMDKEEAAKK